MGLSYRNNSGGDFYSIRIFTTISMSSPSPEF